MITTIEVFADLIGKTATDAEGHPGSGEMTLVFVDGTRARWYHEQDCCEGVDIDDVCGDLVDLIGSPLLVAEEISGSPPEGHKPDSGSETWTFYRFATANGTVTVRWYGSSNGYYSERVDYRYEASDGSHIAGHKRWSE